MVGGSILTYGELQSRASRLASVLLERGAGPGRPVATVLPNGAEQFEVATAASMLGAPYLPVNWHLQAGELAYIFDDADATVVVGHADFEVPLSGAAAESAAPAPQLLVGRDYESALSTADPLSGAESGSGPGLMFYTSGTTARPKGVVHGALADPANRRRGTEGQVALWGWTRHDVYVMAAPRTTPLTPDGPCVPSTSVPPRSSPITSRPAPGWPRSSRHAAPGRSWCRPTSSASSRSPMTNVPPWTSPVSSSSCMLPPPARSWSSSG